MIYCALQYIGRGFFMRRMVSASAGGRPVDIAAYSPFPTFSPFPFRLIMIHISGIFCPPGSHRNQEGSENDDMVRF